MTIYPCQPRLQWQCQVHATGARSWDRLTSGWDRLVVWPVGDKEGHWYLAVNNVRWPLFASMQSAMDEGDRWAARREKRDPP